MDVSDPALFISGLLVSLIGMVIFMHGKRERAPGPLAVGLVLCVFPYFVPSVVWMWTITAACLGGLYWQSKHA